MIKCSMGTNRLAIRAAECNQALRHWLLTIAKYFCGCMLEVVR